MHAANRVSGFSGMGIVEWWNSGMVERWNGGMDACVVSRIHLKCFFVCVLAIAASK